MKILNNTRLYKVFYNQNVQIYNWMLDLTLKKLSSLRLNDLDSLLISWIFTTNDFKSWKPYTKLKEKPPLCNPVLT